MQTLDKPIFRTRKGFVYTIPQYFRKKFFTAAQREKLQEFAECKFFVARNYEQFKIDFSYRIYLQDFDKKETERLKRRFLNV